MDKNLIAKKLNRNVEVITQSFDNYGIEVLSYGFCKITGGRPEVYRVYIEDMLTVCKDLTDVTSDMVKQIIKWSGLLG